MEVGKRKVRATISLPPTATSQTIECHRPLGPATSLPARRALPRIPEEEEKSCLGSTSGSIGSSYTGSCYTGSSYTSSWREENSTRATEDPRKANKSPKRATSHRDWENPYWSSGSLMSMNNSSSSSWIPSTKHSRSFERHKLHGAATSDAEHIYEEIDWPSDTIPRKNQEESDLEEDKEEISFLNLISHERRNHLRYYGCTGWD